MGQAEDDFFEDTLYMVALTQSEGIGAALILDLLAHLGSAKAVFEASESRLSALKGLGNFRLKGIQDKQNIEKANIILKKAQDRQEKILVYTNPAYPALLKTIPDPPVVLYISGQPQLSPKRSIAIVGTRRNTEYGRQLVEEFVSHLTPYSPLIVSGLAYGIDVLAHQQALKQGLPTIGVVASGLDICYPAAHRQIGKQMCQNAGGLISEYPYQTTPETYNFPARNRIIAGLSQATLVVEAAAKGGALITAEIAHSYNREVFAIPGNIKQKYSQGCNKVISELKAALVSSPEHLIELLGWDKPASLGKQISIFQAQIEELSTEHAHIYQILEKKNEIFIDELTYLSGLEASVLAVALLEMEFKNLLVNLPGKKVKLMI